MEWTIEFGGMPQDVTITTSGPASAEGLLGFVRDLVADRRFRPGMSILVDHLAVDPTPLTGADIRAQAQLVVELDELLGPCHVAIVVPNALAFGYARMYELHAAETQIHSHVFYSRAEGERWLETAPGERRAPRSA